MSVKAGRCSIPDCNGVGNRRGLCNVHRLRLKKYGDPLKIVNRPGGAGSVRTDRYIMHESGGRSVLEHVLIAERALGRSLPKGVHVHHIDENRSNNAPSNLVICESQEYHQLLHRRAVALKLSGHAGWRKCYICQQYDDPARLRVYAASGLVLHLACARRRYRERKS
jgi:hypothetical protein